MIEEKSAEDNSTITGEYVTRSAEETFELGRSIGEALEGRAVFLLSGDLGAGKTVFAKGLAAGLEIDPADVTSPSFTLVNVHEGRLRLNHIDLYRLDHGAYAGLGLEEIFDEENSVTVIEWAERLDYVPGRTIQVEISYVSDSERRINIQA
ncbi:MAG TPA: tRNA (adenosine(37)-N6)-threonylcarbamoyltransferase complex ATPase subunit type 1 TsaE [Blastocatellia bacterium]|nr:tRNA (adenosine(37)-N6)-threonylcarbamoyltransferase complex ATPase subunit type 1 TsaE [Blastocatellia bacterium]